MKILIVGSSGYLGTHLIDKISEKDQIICFDKKKLKTDYVKKGNIIKIFHQSVNSEDKVKSAIKGVDVVFFRLGILGGPESIKIENATKFFKINYEYLVKFLKLIETESVKKFIFDSSEQVFGEQDKLSKNDNYSEPYPFNFYGLSKLMCEKYLLNWQSKNKTAVDIFRYPRIMDQSNLGVINTMITSCLNEGKIIINDNPSRKISFLHINDAISANLKSIKQFNTQSRILNLSNNEFITIEKLARKVVKKIGLKSKILIRKDKLKKDFQPLDSRMKSNETQKILNWKPKYSLNDIIDEKINYLKGLN